MNFELVSINADRGNQRHSQIIKPIADVLRLAEITLKKQPDLSIWHFHRTISGPDPKDLQNNLNPDTRYIGLEISDKNNQDYPVLCIRCKNFDIPQSVELNQRFSMLKPLIDNKLQSARIIEIQIR